MVYDGSMSIWITTNVGSTNIKYNMRKKRARKIVSQAIGKGVTVLGTNEVRDVDGLFPSQWQTAEASKSGMKGEAKIHFDTKVWELVEDYYFKVSDSDVIPAATRWLIFVILRHRATGKRVGFWNLHAVAHIDVGGRPGWTKKGRLARQRRRGEENPLVAVHKEEIKNTVEIIQRFKKLVDHIVGLGDLNVDAKADQRVQHPDFPYARFGRINVKSVFRLKGFTQPPTKGRRWIDYIWVWRREDAQRKHFRVYVLKYNVLKKATIFQDHKTITARLSFEFPAS